MLYNLLTVLFLKIILSEESVFDLLKKYNSFCIESQVWNLNRGPVKTLKFKKLDIHLSHNKNIIFYQGKSIDRDGKKKCPFLQFINSFLCICKD